MNPEQYSEEQKADIIRRVEQAKIALEGLHLQPACMPQMFNTGDDIFGIKLTPYLQDILFTPQKSPIQPENI